MPLKISLFVLFLHKFRDMPAVLFWMNCAVPEITFVFCFFFTERACRACQAEYVLDQISMD